MQLYSSVKIANLNAATRHIEGTEGVVRQPQIGDSGTIVHVHVPGKAFIVECVDSEGYTVWVGDFDSSELELISEV